MDILAEKDKTNLDKDLISIIKLLKYKDNSIELVGSSKLKALQYFSDYDLNTYFEKPKQPDLKQFLLTVISNITRYDKLYFIELKFQTLKGEKVKFTPSTIHTLEDKFISNSFFEHLHFIKLDIVGYIQKRFIEISVNYFFIRKSLSLHQYVKSMNDDMNQMKKEKNYFKLLKRKFNIYRANNNKVMCVKLIDYFNSDIGRDYQIKSTLEAMELVYNNYKDSFTKQLIVNELKSIKNTATISSIKSLIKHYKTICNKDAEKMIKTL